jgi:hypothetical protein
MFKAQSASVRGQAFKVVKLFELADSHNYNYAYYGISTTLIEPPRRVPSHNSQSITTSLCAALKHTKHGQNHSLSFWGGDHFRIRSTECHPESRGELLTHC